MSRMQLTEGSSCLPQLLGNEWHPVASVDIYHVHWCVSILIMQWTNSDRTLLIQHCFQLFWRMSISSHWMVDIGQFVYVVELPVLSVPSLMHATCNIYVPIS